MCQIVKPGTQAVILITKSLQGLNSSWFSFQIPNFLHPLHTLMTILSHDALLASYSEAQNWFLRLHVKSNEVWCEEHQQGAMRTVRVKIRHAHSLKKILTWKVTCMCAGCANIRRIIHSKLRWLQRMYGITNASIILVGKLGLFIFIFALCINSIKNTFFIVPTDVHCYKITKMLKHYKNYNTCSKYYNFYFVLTFLWFYNSVHQLEQ
jgi:hypothetical protein